MGFFSNLFKGSSSKQPVSSGGPRGQTGDRERSDQRIKDLIANKDKYQNNLVAGDNRNEYQMRMNALRTGQTFDPSNFSFTDRSGNQISAGSDNRTVGNASGAAAYADKFPLSNFAMNAGPAIAKTAMGGLFPGGGLIMNAFGKAKDAGVNFLNAVPTGAATGVIDQGFEFIKDNFMTSGSITEKPEEVDEFRNYLNNLKGLNASAGSGLSPLMPGPNLNDRDGMSTNNLPMEQITVEDVTQEGLEPFFGRSRTDSFEDFDRRIPPKKTTQDYIDEFNEMFSLDEKKEIFGIEGKNLIFPESQQGIQNKNFRRNPNDTGYYHPMHSSFAEGTFGLQNGGITRL